MGNEILLTMIAQALDIIHKEIVTRNAYDIGIISKEQYKEYLLTMLNCETEEGDKNYDV